MSRTPEEPLSAAIPADVDRPDKVAYGMTSHQLALLAAAGFLALLFWATAGTVLPLPVTVALITPVVVAGLVLAFARRDGMTLDRYGLAAFLHLRISRERVSGSATPPPVWCRMRGRLPAPLRLPVLAVREDGVLELAEGGTAVIVKAGTLPFALRSHGEQAALVGVFGRWLNSLEAPAQILVQARPVDLSWLAENLTETAAALPHPDLEDAALDHAAFLSELSATRVLLEREVYLILRDSTATGRRAKSREISAAVVLRQAQDAAQALAVLGVTATVLDVDSASRVLADALSPGEDRLSGLADPDQIITGFLEEER
ncbi:PrgI family protein [Actinocorallia longicatena]|uniref:PrgI family protein n=1 Tax=Actinocorallia longicatena TaxID=111803 RepID=A0ABP6QMT4_9ACTN